ncbi:hypothetical protein [Nocardioides sp. T2.26MG-1]|uniref:hypothetical protein n=1 Tax=Nocardioides sp. T2.26MG-1 TaxID=3041166 RepID=UPI0024779988|nr:hypothetical protein [Nocardioides sp. T2.26MG-1]CAI9405611.1 hypothetical protein HIDPHFAB_04420 [Nocardioides sp. T2.26MG-1]
MGEVIPNDFPLLSGYPEGREAEPGEGRHGPNRTMKPIVPEACRDRVSLPDHTDHLRAAWTNPEDGRDRQLVTFADVESAQAYAERVLDVFRACPEEVTSEEMEESRRLTVVDSRLGDFAGAASTQYLLQGYPTPGLTTWHVVRVGAAVLLSVTSNEGGAGPDPDQAAADQRRRDARAIARVIDAMHTLIEEYPSEPPFGPDGFGRVTLGMSREELLAVPGVRITGDNGVCGTSRPRAFADTSSRAAASQCCPFAPTWRRPSASTRARPSARCARPTRRARTTIRGTPTRPTGSSWAPATA